MNGAVNGEISGYCNAAESKKPMPRWLWSYDAMEHVLNISGL